MSSSLSRRSTLQAAGALAMAGLASGVAGTTQAAAAEETDSAGDRVVIHPTLPSVPVNNAFTVKVRPLGGSWERVGVYLAKLALIDATTGSNRAQNSSVAMFDFSGTVEVEVTYNPGAFEKVRIRPDSYGIKPEVLGSTVRFTLDRPRNVVVQVDDKIFDCLHLLANPIEQDVPAEGDKNVMYFGPGFHTPPNGELKVPSNTTVYLAPGAVVQAFVDIQGVENSRVIGRGVLYNSKWGAMLIRKCENVTIDGVTILNPRYENIRVAESQNIDIKNLRAFSHQGWGDGIQLYCSENVTIDGCFLRTSDDSIALYTHRWDFYGDTRNITVKNCTLWADVAHPINIGVHGNSDTPEMLENLRYENIDILDHREPQVTYQGAIAFMVGDSNLVRDVRFDDIRVEDFRWGQLIHMRVEYNPKYNTSAGRGIENVYVKDLSYNGKNADLSMIVGLDAEHVVKDVTFENLRVNGRVIADSTGKPRWYLASDGVPMFVNEHVQNLRFLTTEEAAAL
ncbi:right-handed parallel beta-helix repeat-containing protein [Streptomyces sp. PSKA54]|uniref:Right-handed parallel beta-helix repeat-containing protein n=1 Tax=Streptomyces himalayensis subsp. aureolus TaxID=2758039 RepID=A0A7W2HEN2_9ACTN|nr:glycosyl hydrolase family 28 protein [Streptomyces himalayensis]MBA4861015.1 right-handed parallel beta-helix repeat-containing protein [Streptomyces himalayensis subsp. aureolus]